MLVYSEVIYSQEVGQPSSPCVPSSTLLCPGAPLYVTVGQLMPSLGGRGHSILRQVGGFTTALEAFCETGTRFTGADATQLNLHTKYQI